MVLFWDRLLWPLVTAASFLALALNGEPTDSQWRSAHAPGLQPNPFRSDSGGEPAPTNARSDADQDGIPDDEDTCPEVDYMPQFDWGDCLPMDEDPNNDCQPECKARERVAHRRCSTAAVFCNRDRVCRRRRWRAPFRRRIFLYWAGAVCPQTQPT